MEWIGGELMQCKDGNLFFGPLSFPFTLPNFLPFIQAFICYPFHPSNTHGLAVWVYSACVRATVSFGSVWSRLLDFPFLHLWTRLPATHFCHGNKHMAAVFILQILKLYLI
jgi:hypothetical protein